MSPKAYSIYTRRIKVQLSERIILAIEIMAKKEKVSFRRKMEDLLQCMIDSLGFELSLEDEKIVLERANANLKKRMKAKGKQKHADVPVRPKRSH